MNNHYRGRVRSGCLTCRARKVKCDENRPDCNNCTRLKRKCIYKPRRSPSKPTDAAAVVAHNTPSQAHQVRTPEVDLSTQQATNQECLFHEKLSFPDEPYGPGASHSSSQEETPALHVEDLFSPVQRDARSFDHQRDDLSGQQNDLGIIGSPDVQYLMTSQDIYLCTTIDLLAASEASTHSSFAYFVDEVNIPAVSPFDHVNWGRMKVHVAELAIHDKAVASAILAIQAVYKAQANSLPMTNATSVYQSAANIFGTALYDDHHGFNTILVVAFLLCLCEMIIPNETGSIFGQSDGIFVTRMRVWSWNGPLPPISMRILAWLRVLHAAARRSGGPGLLSDAVFSLLPDQATEIPNISLPRNCTDASVPLYDYITAPIFALFVELQKISTHIANLSHYHRSRVTGSDQKEVSDIIGGFKLQMYSLWNARPDLMRFKPGQLRVQFPREVSEPLITLVGICIATYNTEIIETGRNLSDPPFASLEAKQAMRRIRLLIEGDWNSSDGENLNPAYLRPLFLCAIESIDADETKWAVAQLKKIRNPICRSDFFASFAESLAEAQRDKRRRVTTRYFCLQTFGVPPPYL
ncbi:uncharacterized protein Z518_09601 [Rhinocladiella mackenziei CBS 650.93]|uniref:Zn(2)-C6 fungal-type domain-containing protein n=1 Tax=Rhinocladiella mackenziei CBS 650.93 TaxID=1442369 RepID=A0A0D2I7P7_9EURO|nr:uncharacterized protein Z518_09601 [Rhinocladiella mackenziei CBS 650.93]KIX01874.1 hypothetical protein Z518_09601 [Rhinocladiella mackenziei CBS 650.93]